MGYYASGSGDATIKEGKLQELKDVLETNEKNIDSDIEFEFTNKCNRIDFWQSDDHWHEEDIMFFLDLISPYITEGSMVFNGEDDCHWRYVFDLDSEEWSDEGGTVIYSNKFYHFKETEGDGTYKVSQIEKHLDATVLDEFYNPQLTGSKAKPINLDNNILLIIKAYYSGKIIYIEEVA